MIPQLAKAVFQTSGESHDSIQIDFWGHDSNLKKNRFLIDYIELFYS